MPINTTGAFAFDQITVSSTALPLIHASLFDADDVDSADRVRITTVANPVRYRYDGTAPDTSTGHILPANSTLELVGRKNIQQFQMIRNSTTDAEVAISLEKFS